MGLRLEDLNKKAESLRFSLEKAGITNIPPVEVAFNMDVSKSYEDEHEDGTTTGIIERLVPWGLLLDPDEKLDLFAFSSTWGNRPPACYVGEVTAENYQTFMRKYVIGRVPNWNGGTMFAPVWQMNLEHFGWRPASQQAPAPSSGGSLFGKLWGGNKSSQQQTSPAPLAVKRKSLIIHNTDGVNEDKDASERLLAEMEQRGDQVYVMLLGLSNEKVDFSWINRMADKYSNVGKYTPKNIHEFMNLSDEQLNEILITKELKKWLTKPLPTSPRF